MQRSKIEKLPQHIREVVDRRIIEQGYDGYPVIAAWLNALGHDITKDNLYRHGRKLKKAPPTITHIRLQMEQAGISPGGNDAELQGMLTELGWLRLREQRLIAKIMKGHTSN